MTCKKSATIRSPVELRIHDFNNEHGDRRATILEFMYFMSLPLKYIKSNNGDKNTKFACHTDGRPLFRVWAVAKSFTRAGARNWENGTSMEI